MFGRFLLDNSIFSFVAVVNTFYFCIDRSNCDEPCPGWFGSLGAASVRAEKNGLDVSPEDSFRDDLGDSGFEVVNIGLNYLFEFCC